jgi:hypothetical protein
MPQPVSRYDAAAVLARGSQRRGLDLADLVAEGGLSEIAEVHRELMSRAAGCFYPATRRYKAGLGEERGQKVGRVLLDDHTYANTANKRAIGVPRDQLVGSGCSTIVPGRLIAAGHQVATEPGWTETV